MEPWFDHFPLYAEVEAALAADRELAERRRVIAAALPVPVIAPVALPASVKIPPNVTERYGIVFCRDCAFPIAYCGCARSAAPASMPQDGPAAAVSLERRIAECKGK